jgi:serine phosphatase RsbU (regulator of sigma subunit)
MGHGVRAALVTAMLRAFLEEMTDEFEEPGRLLETLNRQLCRILAKAGDDVLFATAFYLLADTDKRSLRYADAGHPLPMHLGFKADQARIMEHRDSGLVLGVFADAVFVEEETPYETGDALILYTDGLMDVENAHGEAFGQERMLEIAQARRDIPVPEIFGTLLEQALKFARDGAFSDDICLLSVEFR